MDDLIKDLFKNYLKIVDNYIVPFLRSQNGMLVVIGIIIFLILFYYKIYKDGLHEAIGFFLILCGVAIAVCGSQDYLL